MLNGISNFVTQHLSRGQSAPASSTHVAVNNPDPTDPPTRRTSGGLGRGVMQNSSNSLLNLLRSANGGSGMGSSGQVTLLDRITPMNSGIGGGQRTGMGASIPEGPMRPMTGGISGGKVGMGATVPQGPMRPMTSGIGGGR